nr:nuclear ribonuclease z [Quercus suber]
MSDFIVDQNNIDALRSRILVMEIPGQREYLINTFVCKYNTKACINRHMHKVTHIYCLHGFAPLLITLFKWRVQEITDTHIYLRFYQIIGHAERFENKAILLIHFSARHTAEVEFLRSQKVSDGNWSSVFLFWAPECCCHFGVGGFMQTPLLAQKTELVTL